MLLLGGFLAFNFLQSESGSDTSEEKQTVSLTVLTPYSNDKFSIRVPKGLEAEQHDSRLEFTHSAENKFVTIHIGHDRLPGRDTTTEQEEVSLRKQVKTEIGTTNDKVYEETAGMSLKESKVVDFQHPHAEFAYKYIADLSLGNGDSATAANYNLFTPKGEIYVLSVISTFEISFDDTANTDRIAESLRIR